MDRQTSVDRPDTVVAGVNQTHVATTTYDRASNVVATTDEVGRMTRYTYDPLNRQVAMLLPSLAGQPRKSATVYDAVGNATRSVDAVGTVTKSVFDRIDRRTSITDAKGKTTSLTYDMHGNLITLVDPRNVKTRYAYDLLDRVTKEGVLTGPNENNDYDDRVFVYDTAGNVIEKTDRQGRVTRYRHDAIGQRAEKIGSAQPAQHNHHQLFQERRSEVDQRQLCHQCLHLRLRWAEAEREQRRITGWHADCHGQLAVRRGRQPHAAF